MSKNQVYVSDMTTLINFLNNQNFANVMSQVRSTYLEAVTKDPLLKNKTTSFSFWLDLPEPLHKGCGMYCPSRSVPLRNISHEIKLQNKSIAYIRSTYDLLRILTVENFEKIFDDITNEFKNFVVEKDTYQVFVNEGWTFECVF